MMKTSFFTKSFLVVIGCCCISAAFGQGNKTNSPNQLIMFYNTENLFDYFNDPVTNDEEFLPISKSHWTKERYQEKINKLGKVILSTGVEPPTIVGMAEVENEKVLKDLIKNTALSKFNYQIIHYDSPDPRGIDVAAIYRSEKMNVVFSKAIKINFKKSKSKTRDILYIKAVVEKKDTLHFYFNHWPSRRGGRKASDENRSFVARILKQQIDSLVERTGKVKIIVMGDFNDEPDDPSVQKVLNAAPPDANQNGLVNLSYPWLKNVSYKGSHYFKGKWGILDQVIVSSSLLAKNEGWYCKVQSASIFFQDFLLVEDNNFGGKTPFRTYSGMKYTGGFSDHLPILLELYKN